MAVSGGCRIASSALQIAHTARPSSDRCDTNAADVLWMDNVRGRSGAGRGAAGRKDSQHVDAFDDDSDAAISQRSSRAGLGSATRQQQQSGGKFNRHTQHLNASGGRVPKFLADIVAASSQAVRRQLPTSIVDGLARADDEDDDRAADGDEEAKQRRDSRIAREMELRQKEEGSERPVREDELPVIANLPDYAQHTAELTELLGRAPTLQQQPVVAVEEESAERKEADSEAQAGSRRQRLEDVRADEVERATGQHVFRKSKVRAAVSAEQSTQPASKKTKTAAAAGKTSSSSKLSFDEEDV